MNKNRKIRDVNNVDNFTCFKWLLHTAAHLPMPFLVFPK